MHIRRTDRERTEAKVRAVGPVDEMVCADFTEHAVKALSEGADV
jgi:hypothetical protein